MNKCMKMEATDSSETTRSHIRADRNLNVYHGENLKSLIFIPLLPCKLLPLNDYVLPLRHPVSVSSLRGDNTDTQLHWGVKDKATYNVKKIVLRVLTTRRRYTCHVFPHEICRGEVTWLNLTKGIRLLQSLGRRREVEVGTD
jgi:hypothetical protein